MYFRVNFPFHKPLADHEICSVGEQCLVASACKDSGEGKNLFPHNPRKLEKDSLLWCDEGENGCILVIRSGIVAVSRCSQDGTERILAILGEGQAIGQVMLFSPSAQPVLVRACTDVEICQFPKRELERLVREDTKIAEILIRILSANCWALEQQIETLVNVSARDQIKHVLLNLAQQFAGGAAEEVELPFTHDDLSKLLGLNRVTVTRILKELEEEEGVLLRGHSSLTVRVDALKHARGVQPDKSRLDHEAVGATAGQVGKAEPAPEVSLASGYPTMVKIERKWNRNERNDG